MLPIPKHDGPIAMDNRSPRKSRLYLTPIAIVLVCLVAGGFAGPAAAVAPHAGSYAATPQAGPKELPKARIDASKLFHQVAADSPRPKAAPEEVACGGTDQAECAAAN
jgi:hypothetical protein